MTETGEPRMDLEKLRERDGPMNPDERLVLDLLRRSGPLVSRTITRVTGLTPASTLTRLSVLRRRGLVVYNMADKEWSAAAPSSEAASQPETLDAAWKEAEAALPEGWWFQVDRGGTIGEPYPDEQWRAKAGEPRWSKDYRSVEVYGPTPAAALQELATRLKEGKE